MERVNARTMEIYRRMGLAPQIRAAGLRSDCPMDVYIVLASNECRCSTFLTRRSPKRRLARAQQTTAACHWSLISSSRSTRWSRSKIHCRDNSVRYRPLRL